MKQFIPLLLAVLFIGAGCVLQKPQADPSSPEPVSRTESFVGVVQSVDEETRIANVLLADGSTEQVQSNGFPVLAATDVGALFQMEGEREPSSRVIDLSNLTPLDTNLVVVSPRVDATVTSPLVVTGFGRVFEQQFAWRIKDSTGTVVDSGSAMTHAEDIGQYGPYSFEVFLPAMSDVHFTLEVLEYSAKDGSEQDLNVVPLALLSAKSTSVKAYFRNGKMGSYTDCTDVFPVERSVAQTSAVGRAAIAELLKGPTDAERLAGYSSAIPSGAALYSLVINARTATADFSPLLNPPGGSCAVMAIRSQIDNTLLQFDTVDDVVIQVNGNADTALQP